MKKEQKDIAVLYAMELLESKKLTIEELYQELLAPSLTTFECECEDQEVCIWKEHFRTSIIRTILESSYLYIIELLVSVIIPIIIFATPPGVKTLKISLTASWVVGL